EAGRLYIGHGGNQDGFLSHFYLDPPLHSAYLVAYNTNATDQSQSTSKLDLDVRNYYLRESWPSFEPFQGLPDCVNSRLDTIAGTAFLILITVAATVAIPLMSCRGREPVAAISNQSARRGPSDSRLLPLPRSSK